MFEIKATTNEVSDGTLAISWCVDAETIKYLSDNKISDPQVVIVVAPQGRSYHPSKEIRTIVPMKDLITYVNFRSLGPNKIFALLSKMTNKSAKDCYLSRDSGSYTTTLVNSDGSDWSSVYSSAGEEFRLTVSSPLSVIVPAEAFAEEPSQWEKTWVNHFFRSKPEDQCNFRRRRLFAYTVQPFIFMFDWLLRLFLFTLSLAFGCRNVTAKPLFHLLSMSFSDHATKSFEDGSYFIRSVPEDDIYGWQPDSVVGLMSYIVRKFWAFPLMPIFSIPLAIATFYHWSFHLVPLLVMAAIVTALLLCLTVVGFFVTDGLVRTWDFISNLLAPKVSNAMWYLDREEMDLLSCSKQDGPMTFQKLPSHKKSLRLRFKDLKSKVCKPFSA